MEKQETNLFYRPVQCSADNKSKLGDEHLRVILFVNIDFNRFVKQIMFQEEVICSSYRSVILIESTVLLHISTSYINFVMNTLCAEFRYEMNASQLNCPRLNLP